MSFSILAVCCLLFGVGFGFFVQRAGLCFAVGLAEVFMGKGRRIGRMFLVLFIITGLGFLLSGYVSPDLGFKPIGQIRGAGFYNVLSGVLFGMGIMLSGGCILGMLRQIGEGALFFVVVMLSMIPGMALVVFWVNPLLEANYHVQKLLLPDVLGVPALWVMLVLVLAAAGWLAVLLKKASR